MTNINQKQELMQSLQSLDSRQTEKVLEYVKSLTRPLKHDDRMKQEALKQIRQALANPRTLAAI
jgi:hypothetical protein